MYSVPVNVKDPGANLSAAITYGTALTKNGKVRLNMTLVADVLSNTSYQSCGGAYLTMPRFSIASSLELQDALKGMGLKRHRYHENHRARLKNL